LGLTGTMPVELSGFGRIVAELDVVDADGIAHAGSGADACLVAAQCGRVADAGARCT
jgi:hypothetical protein